MLLIITLSLFQSHSSFTVWKCGKLCFKKKCFKIFSLNRSCVYFYFQNMNIKKFHAKQSYSITHIWKIILFSSGSFHNGNSLKTFVAVDFWVVAHNGYRGWWEMSRFAIIGHICAKFWVVLLGWAAAFDVHVVCRFVVFYRCLWWNQVASDGK